MGRPNAPAWRRGPLALGAVLVLGAVGCGSDDPEPAVTSGRTTPIERGSLEGTVAVQGEAAGFRAAEAATELFDDREPGVGVRVEQLDARSAIASLCAGRVDVAAVSRPLQRRERATCRRRGVQPVRIEVATEGMDVVTSQALGLECLEVGELERLWRTGSRVGSLSDLDDDFPEGPVSLYAPRRESPTVTLLGDVLRTEVRLDATRLEEDRDVARRVAMDTTGLGLVSHPAYQQARGDLNLVELDDGDGEGCVEPTEESIQDGSYPVARTLTFVVARDALVRPEVAAYVEYAVDQQRFVARRAGLSPLSDEQEEDALDKLEAINPT